VDSQLLAGLDREMGISGPRRLSPQGLGEPGHFDDPVLLRDHREARALDRGPEELTAWTGQVTRRSQVNDPGDGPQAEGEAILLRTGSVRIPNTHSSNRRYRIEPGLFSVKLLCITDPLTKIRADASVALYNGLAEDPRFELYHLERMRSLRTTRYRPTDSAHRSRFRVSIPRRQPPPRERPGTPILTWCYSRTDKPFPPAFLPRLIRQEKKVRFVAPAPRASSSASRALSIEPLDGCSPRAW
jgi:hypothetical protein